MNESKKFLNATKEISKDKTIANAEQSIVFKLFRDLETDDLEKASKVFIDITNCLVL